MTHERRYNDDEAREIFEAAASERDQPAGGISSAEGLTLAELTDIGREVGLAPQRIAEAASAIELRRDLPPLRTHLGMPLAVGRTVDVPRAPTDHEWELLVSELRQTFGAKGKVGSHGSIREWTNGNLHAYVEPTETGHRLRLGTMKGNAIAVGRMGMALIGTGLVLVVFLALTGQLADGFFAPLLLGSMGGVGLAASALGLPAWAREREAQMEHIAARARALIGPEPEAD